MVLFLLKTSPMMNFTQSGNENFPDQYYQFIIDLSFLEPTLPIYLKEERRFLGRHTVKLNYGWQR
jgi:hypothetical protein